MESLTESSKSRVCIPKALRERLNLGKGARSNAEVDRERIILSKPAGWRSLRGIAAGSDLLASMPVRLHVPAADDIWQAALLKSRARIPCADGSAAALSRRLDATLVTGDPDFAGIADLRVDWLKRA